MDSGNLSIYSDLGKLLTIILESSDAMEDFLTIILKSNDAMEDFMIVILKSSDAIKGSLTVILESSEMMVVRQMKKHLTLLVKCFFKMVRKKELKL